jgi:hypothetical protein
MVSVGASLILAAGQGLAGDNLTILEGEDSPEVLIESRRLYKPFARKQLERTANRGIDLSATF